MVVAYIEIERDENWKGKGNIKLIPKGEHYVILHVQDFPGGGLGRSFFRVDTAQENIDAVKASHKDVKVYTTPKDMQIRALVKKPGTPTDAMVNKLVNNLKTKFNIDLKNETNTTANKSWEDYLKQDTDSIDDDEIKCTNCGTINQITNASITSNYGNCSNCGFDLNKNGKLNVRTFDISNWEDPTVK